jgi:hypothetical protein
MVLLILGIILVTLRKVIHNGLSLMMKELGSLILLTSRFNVLVVNIGGDKAKVLIC